MKSITLEQPAKINLALDIVGERAGYHLVRMILVSIPLFDTVTVETTTSGFSVSMVNEEAGGIITVDPERLPYVPEDERNIAVRAVKKMFSDYGLPGGIHVTIRKRIPVSAGLAGGSTDAAGVIRAIDGMFGLGLPEEKLREIALSIGADVPFCLHGGAALCEGIGEILTPIERNAHFPIVLLKPFGAVSTKDVYAGYDKLPPAERSAGNAEKIRSIEEGLRTGDVSLIAGNLFNELSPVTEALHPEVPVLFSRLRERGAKAVLLSGSGPCCYGIFGSAGEAEEAAQAFRKEELEFAGVFEI